MSQPRPLRAEHIGSFPRPAALLQARDDHAAGRISAEALRRAEDEAIRPVVAMQERVGIGAITDGELRRASWRDAPFVHLDGFTRERTETDFTFHLFDGSTRKAGPVPSVTGKVRRRTPMTADTYSLLAAMTKGLPKANLPTPSVTHFFRGRASIDRTIYTDVDALMADVGRAYREEVADLATRGCTYLQMDEVPLAVICDPRNRDIVQKRGEDPDRVIDAYIDAINASIRDRPANMAARSICAAATWATAWPMAATTPSPSGCSAGSTSTATCSSMTRRAPATSRRCASCPRASASRSAS
jgi:5-methyltetrahydropteroyltriglutamate--homocysteine methyltransferase